MIAICPYEVAHNHQDADNVRFTTQLDVMRNYL